MSQRRPSKQQLEDKIADLEKKLDALSSAIVRNADGPPTRLDLEIGMHDFGPIQDARIRLRPLTVFIGPNNSGKSYAALLAHSAVSLLGSGRLAVLGKSSWSAHMGAMRNHSSQARPVLKAGGRKNEFLVTGRGLGALAREAADSIATAFLGQIERNFSTYPSLLVQSRRSHANVNIPGILEISIPHNKKELAVPLKHSMNAAMAREALVDNAVDGIKVRGAGGTALACTFSTASGGTVDARSAHDKLLSQVIAAALNGHGHAVPATTIYLPAARSGIIEAYRTILPAVARRYAHERGGSHDTQRMRAVNYEFLAAMLEIDNKKGQFSRAANELEYDTLHGKITLEYAAGELVPDIYYARQGKSRRTTATPDGPSISTSTWTEMGMPIHRASSAVSELAPLVLFLRHVVKKGDLLIIEEPESHLHPKNQVALAKCIVRLVRTGLNVVVTTHSTYIVERFSAYLRAGRMTAAQRTRVGIDRGLYLEADDIAPYLFDMGENGTTVSAINHSPLEGISQEEFMRVNEALHEENIRADKLVG